MWDKRVVGQSVSFKRNPFYWQKGKPYLDRVTWTYVSDQNTRELQLRGGQIEINEFPPFSSIKKLQNTPGVKMFLFPSTRTDYLLMNQAYAPLKDRHVRRAISYSIDRAAISRRSSSASESPPTPSCRRRCPTTTRSRRASSTTRARRRPRWPSRSTRTDSRSRCLSAQARRTRTRSLRSSSRHSRTLKINVKFRQVDTSTEFSQIQEGKYQLGFSYWTMDIADPDELVTFAVDPKGGGANSFFTGYKQPEGSSSSRTRRNARRTRRSGEASTRRSSGSPHRTRSWGSSSTRRSAGPRPRK